MRWRWVRRCLAITKVIAPRGAASAPTLVRQGLLRGAAGSPEPAKQVSRCTPLRAMASEIFGTAALFWVLIPVGLAGGALLLKLLKD